MSKVLVSCGICTAKDYSFGLWLSYLANQTYDDFDVLVVANGKDQDILKKMLDKTYLIRPNGDKKHISSATIPGSEEYTVKQSLFAWREKARQYFNENGYDYIFWMDSDTIPIRLDAIEQLMSHKKRFVSGLYFYKNGRSPIAIDKDTHRNISLDKLESAFKAKQLIEVEGVGYGCVLMDKEPMQIPFNYDLFKEKKSDDFSHTDSVLEKTDIRVYLDPAVVCRHYDNKSETDIAFRHLGGRIVRI